MSSKFYRKIDSPYKRENNGRFFLPEFADPLFEEHFDDVWEWDYKWDGSSVGFEFVVGEPFGRTEGAAFSWQQWKTVVEWGEFLKDRFYSYDGPALLDFPEYVYGELVGPGIQKNPHGLKELAVVSFDSRAGGNYVGLSPVHGRKTLREAVELFRAGKGTQVLDVTSGSDYFEGVVGRLAGNQNVITKLKVKDKWSW